MSAHQLAGHSPRNVPASPQLAQSSEGACHRSSWHGHSPRNVRASQSADMGIVLGTYVPAYSWHGHSPRNVRASQSAGMGIVLGTYVPANQLVSA